MSSVSVSVVQKCIDDGFCALTGKKSSPTNSPDLMNSYAPPQTTTQFTKDAPELKGVRLLIGFTQEREALVAGSYCVAWKIWLEKGRRRVEEAP